MTTNTRTRHYIILLMLLSGLLTNCVPYHNPKLTEEEMHRTEGWYIGKEPLLLSPDNLKFKASGGVKRAKLKVTHKNNRWWIVCLANDDEVYELRAPYYPQNFQEGFAYRANWVIIKCNSEKSLTVGAMPNPTSEPRTMRIVIICGPLYYTLKVEQKAGPAKNDQPADSAFFADPDIRSLFNLYQFGR